MSAAAQSGSQEPGSQEPGSEERHERRSSAAPLAYLLWVIIAIGLAYGLYKTGSLVPALFEN
jgi:uncharacterized protein HemX